MMYGGHVLEHTKDEGISLLGIESCYMVGALIHHMVCWKERFNILVLRMRFPPRCFLTICSLRKDNNACLFVVRQRVYVLTDDSDSVVLVIYASSHHLDCQSFRWVSVVGQKVRDIPIRDICSDIVPFGYLSLPLYAIKWCETTSHFLGCGKKTAWAYQQ